MGSLKGRRLFLKNLTFGSAGLVAVHTLSGCQSDTFGKKDNESRVERTELTDHMFETPGIFKGMPIRATFLDEVSWDIPHQNWGVKEWDKDFQAMKAIGIDTVYSL